MREAIRRLIFLLSAAALLTAGTATTALASTTRPLHQTAKGPDSIYSVGLPYTFTIDYISGGSTGVNTPSFYTNSTGKICIDPNLYVKTNADGGSQYNDNRYKALMYHNETFGDQHVGTDKNFNSDTDRVYGRRYETWREHHYVWSRRSANKDG